MLLASTTPLKSRAVKLIDDYSAYVSQTLSDALDATTETLAVQLRAARGKASDRSGLGAFLAEAMSISADPGFPALPTPLRDDITKLVEEIPLAQTHIDNITRPDALFTSLPADRKHELTERATVDAASVGVLKDLLHFNARANRAPGQPPSIPGPKGGKP